MATTNKSNLVNVELFADSVSAKLGDAIRLLPLAFVQNFEGQQGGTITVPKYEYIGDATIIAEGIAIDPSLLTQGSDALPVVKAGKAVSITDEAAGSGFGDPIGESENQIVRAVANGVEKEMFDALATATLAYDATVGGTVTDAVVDAATYLAGLALFGEDQDGEKFLVVNPNQTANIKGDKANFIDGVFVDATVVFSNRVPATSAYIVKPGALGLYLSKEVEVESDRDILKSLTVIKADEHFATHLRDASKAVKITVS